MQKKVLTEVVWSVLACGFGRGGEHQGEDDEHRSDQHDDLRPLRELLFTDEHQGRVCSVYSTPHLSDRRLTSLRSAGLLWYTSQMCASLFLCMLPD